jgi:two-component system cell cycle sensor histidine kinase/response regulator CckA
VLEVSDDGLGIPQEIIDRIFEPFFTTKGVGAGNGLGLSTVQGVLRSHCGFIDATSSLGKGSTFRVCLPAHTEVAAVTEKQDDEPAPRGAGEVILVVDDEAPIIEITRQILERSGYGVRTATNGQEAIELYRREQEMIALVVTDMMMPVMDGAALITALRLINSDVPIIAVSGHIDPNQMSRVTEAGATTFLPKPYSGEAVLHLLSQVLQKSRLLQEPPELNARTERLHAE